MFRIIFIHSKVARATVGTIAIGVLIISRGSSKSKTITIIIEDSVIICVTPRVFINKSIAIIIVANVVVRESNDFKLH